MNFELFNLGPYSVGYPPETKRMYFKMHLLDPCLRVSQLVIKVGRQGWSSRLLSLHHLAYLVRQGGVIMGRVDTSLLESVFSCPGQLNN